VRRRDSLTAGHRLRSTDPSLFTACWIDSMYRMIEWSVKWSNSHSVARPTPDLLKNSRQAIAPLQHVVDCG